MPVDRPNRTRAADALAAYLRGEIDNFKLDDETQALATDDRTLREISYRIWFTYDDIKRHKVHASPEGWRFLVRCVAFLRTDLDVQPGRPRRSEWEFMPFASDQQWHEHEHLIQAESIPAYNPELHAKSPWGPILGAEITWKWFLASAVVIAVVMYLFCRCP